MLGSKLFLGLLVIVAATSCASAMRRTVPGAYIVEFEETYDRDSFYAHVAHAAEPRMNFNYSLFKGASIKFKHLNTAHTEASDLLSHPSVKKVWPVRLYSRPQHKVIWTGQSVESIQNVKRRSSQDTFSPHVMTQVGQLHAKGFTGKGVKIGIIDTGIDYTHPALGGGFGPGHLVSYGYDIVGDKYDGENTPEPDPDPYDGCGGHGTHVAGIIAAQANEYGFIGAAPGATLGMYRALGCQGGAGDDVLIDAYLRAFEDGSNIITASLGGSSGWSEEPWAVVVSRIVEQGVPCTLSAGNGGSHGLFFASAAAVGQKVTAVASVDNVVTPYLLVDSFYTVNGADNKTFHYSLGRPQNWAGVKLPLWTPNFNIAGLNSGCDPYPANTTNLSGYVVLLKRGTCDLDKKAQNAATFGARYIMYYNDGIGANGPRIEVDGIIAVGMARAEQGEKWVSHLFAGDKVVLDFLDPKKTPIILTEVPNNITGGFASTYTSWGPTFEADFKPQLAAPGGNILSTYSQKGGSYAVLSGTSMSCPITAAIYALVSNVRGTLDPRELSSVLASTATPLRLSDGKVTSPMLSPVAQVGAGLLQAHDAAFAKTVLSVTSLAFNDTDNLVDTLNFTVKNTGSEEVTYHLGSLSAATAFAFGSNSTPDAFPGMELADHPATIELSETRVSIPAGGENTIVVTVRPPNLDGSRLPVYSGYITLNASNGETLSLPYQGIVGSLHSTKVLIGADLYSGTEKGEDPVKNDGKSTFLLPRFNGTNATLPAAVPNFAFGSPLVKIEAIAVGENGAMNNIGSILGTPWPYVTRDSYNQLWKGQLTDGSFAPAGTYFFRVSALHIFGDASDPAEYDISETVRFSIRYM